MRYELSDYEWIAIKQMLPNKSRGVRRVNDRRLPNGASTRIWLRANESTPANTPGKSP
jgi:hypothetical protein